MKLDNNNDFEKISGTDFEAVDAYLVVRLSDTTKEELETNEDYLLTSVLHYALPRNTGKELYRHVNEYDQVLRLIELGSRYRLDYNTEDYSDGLVDKTIPTSKPLLCSKAFLYEDAPYLVKYIYVFEDDCWHLLHDKKLYVISGAGLDELAPMEKLTNYNPPVEAHFAKMTPIQRKIAELVIERNKIKIEDYL